MYIMSRTNALRKLITHCPGQRSGQETEALSLSVQLRARAGHLCEYAVLITLAARVCSSGAEITPSLALHHHVLGLHLLSPGRARTRCNGTLSCFTIP